MTFRLKVLSIPVVIFLLIPSADAGLPLSPESDLIPSHETNLSAHMFKEFGDLIRAKPEAFPEDIPRELQDPQLTRVTHDFGPSRIDTRLLPIRTPKVSAIDRVWSSWWYPKREDTLFRNNGSAMSPLRKYDLYRRYKAERDHLPMPASAADIEAAAYDPNALIWEGLCDAWALAAVSSPEPARSVSFDFGWLKKITFTVGDLKALLLKTYEGVDDSQLRYYGQKFTGDENGWIYPDIFPDQMHSFIEVELFGAHKAFVMDHDPGVEVWNIPVYAANYLIESIPGTPNAVSVTLWTYNADSTIPSDPNRMDFVGIKDDMREYHYVLTGDLAADGTLTVTSGYWIVAPNGVNSRKDHPDYVVELPARGGLVRKATNPQIDVATVDEILGASFVK
jgi:hypothetical protein